MLALHQATRLVQSLDVRTKLLVKLSIVCPIYRHFRADGLLGDGAEVDSRNRSVREHRAEIRLPLVDGGARIPIETDAHTLAHRRSAHTRLSVHITRVESEAHDLKVRLASCRGFERVELVDFVHLRVEEPFLRISQTLNEGRIRHVRVNLLNDKPFGTLSLVLVRPFSLHLRLPFLLTLKVLGIPLADVLQDTVHRLRDAILARSRPSHEAVH